MKPITAPKLTSASNSFFIVFKSNLSSSKTSIEFILFAYKLVDILGGNSKALKNGMLWDMLEEEKE